MRGIRSIVSDEAKAGSIDLRGRLEVTDAQGSKVAEIGFGEAVKLRV